MFPPDSAAPAGPLRPACLRALPLILTPPGSSGRRLLEAALGQEGLRPPVAIETSQREAVLPLVLAGACAAVMPEAIAVLATAQRAVTVPFDPPMMRDLVIVRQPGSPTPAAVAFLAVTGVWDRADYEQLTRRVCDASGYGAGSAAARGVASGQRALFDALLAHMDADGDQQITPGEFTASIGRAVAGLPGFDAAVRAAARTLIQAADEDGNGVLDTGEYTRLASVCGASAGEAARAFTQLDLTATASWTPRNSPRQSASSSPASDTAAAGNLALGHL